MPGPAFVRQGSLLTEIPNAVIKWLHIIIYWEFLNVPCLFYYIDNWQSLHFFILWICDMTTEIYAQFMGQVISSISVNREQSQCQATFSYFYTNFSLTTFWNLGGLILVVILSQIVTLLLQIFLFKSCMITYAFFILSYGTVLYKYNYCGYK